MICVTYSDSKFEVSYSAFPPAGAVQFRINRCGTVSPFHRQKWVGKSGNLATFLRHFSEARPLFVFISRNSESRPRAAMTLSTKMAAPVKRFIFFVFLPIWSCTFLLCEQYNVKLWCWFSSWFAKEANVSKNKQLLANSWRVSCRPLGVHVCACMCMRVCGVCECGALRCLCLETFAWACVCVRACVNAEYVCVGACCVCVCVSCRLLVTCALTNLSNLSDRPAII